MPERCCRPFFLCIIFETYPERSGIDEFTDCKMSSKVTCETNSTVGQRRKGAAHSELSTRDMGSDSSILDLVTNSCDVSASLMIFWDKQDYVVSLMGRSRVTSEGFDNSDLSGSSSDDNRDTEEEDEGGDDTTEGETESDNPDELLTLPV